MKEATEVMGNFFNHSVLVVINRYFILGAKSLSVMPSNEVNAWVMEEGHRDSLRIIITHDDSLDPAFIFCNKQLVPRRGEDTESPNWVQCQKCVYRKHMTKGVRCGQSLIVEK